MIKHPDGIKEKIDEHDYKIHFACQKEIIGTTGESFLSRCHWRKTLSPHPLTGTTNLQ